MILKLSVCLPLPFSSSASSFRLSFLFGMKNVLGNIRIDQLFSTFLFHFLNLSPIPHPLIPVFFLHMMENTSVSKHLFCPPSSISCLLFHPFRPSIPSRWQRPNKPAEVIGQRSRRVRARNRRSDDRAIRRSKERLSVMNYCLGWRRDSLALEATSVVTREELTLHVRKGWTIEAVDDEDAGWWFGMIWTRKKMFVGWGLVLLCDWVGR